MKKFKKIASLLLAAIMVIAMAVPAMAAPSAGGNKKIVIEPSETVKISEASEFVAYRILDIKSVVTSTNPAQVVYTVPEGMKSFYNNRYGLTGSEADYAYTVAERIAAEADMFTFGVDVVNAITAGTASAESKPGRYETSNYVIDGLAAGYYVVNDNTTGTKSAVMIQSTDEDVTLKLKADQPTINKTFADQTNIHEKNVGDIESYELKSNVPVMTGYKAYQFVMTDKLSKGLTLDKGSFVVTVGGEPLHVKANDDDKTKSYVINYTENADGSLTIQIVFVNFIQYSGQAGAEVKVAYNATINKDAVIGVAGNPNEVTLTYSNDPSQSEGGLPDIPRDTDPTGETPKSEVWTYLTGIDLLKVDADGKTLAGAVFEIAGTGTINVLVDKETFVEDAEGSYWLLKDGTYTTTSPETAGINPNTYADVDKKYTKTTDQVIEQSTEEVKVTLTSGEDGLVRFSGLPAGDYTITEIKSPDGFNMLEKPILIHIAFTAPADPDTDAKCTWSGTFDMQDGKNSGTLEMNDTGHLEFSVVNQTGTRLPSTGGMGTTILYVVGGILVLSAAIVLVSKKRAAK